MVYPADYINKVVCGDCLEVMQGIPDGSIDLVLLVINLKIGGIYGLLAGLHLIIEEKIEVIELEDRIVTEGLDPDKIGLRKKREEEKE